MVEAEAGNRAIRHLDNQADPISQNLRIDRAVACLDLD